MLRQTRTTPLANIPHHPAMLLLALSAWLAAKKAGLLEFPYNMAFRRRLNKLLHTLTLSLNCTLFMSWSFL